MVDLAIAIPCLLPLVVWAIWDILVLAGVLKQPLISVQIITLSKAYPILPFTLGFIPGVLAGHFFWQMVQ